MPAARLDQLVCVAALVAACSTRAAQTPTTLTQRYPSGRIRSTEQLVGGVRHGTIESFHENGKRASRGEYRNGVPHGVFDRWDSTGQLTTRSAFIAGKQVWASSAPTDLVPHEIIETLHDERPLVTGTARADVPVQVLFQLGVGPVGEAAITRVTEPRLEPDRTVLLATDLGVRYRFVFAGVSVMMTPADGVHELFLGGLAGLSVPVPPVPRLRPAAAFELGQHRFLSVGETFGINSGSASALYTGVRLDRSISAPRCHFAPTTVIAVTSPPASSVGSTATGARSSPRTGRSLGGTRWGGSTCDSPRADLAPIAGSR